MVVKFSEADKTGLREEGVMSLVGGVAEKESKYSAMSRMSYRQVPPYRIDKRFWVPSSHQLFQNL